MAERVDLTPRQQAAAKNRERLLAAAEELFAERGLQVTLNDIARHAGLGVGTAYRRFANKDEVLDALFAIRLERAVELAQECVADPVGWNGLARYLEESLRREVTDRSTSQLVNSVNAAPDQRRVNEWRDRLAPLVEKMVQTAQAQGDLRADITTADIIFLRAALTTVVDMSRDSGPDVFRRYLAIVLDGLRASPSTPTQLPVPAPAVVTSHSGMAAVRWQPRPKDGR